MEKTEDPLKTTPPPAFWGAVIAWDKQGRKTMKGFHGRLYATWKS